MTYPYNCLSETELLSNFYEKINQCVKGVNTVTEFVQKMNDEMMPQEVIKVVTNKINDGTFENLINRNIFGQLNLDIKDLGVNIKKYKLNDDRDWTDALRRAYIDCPDGGTLVIPPGDYHLGKRDEDYILNIRKNINIIGSVGSNLILNNTVNSSTDMFRVEPLENKELILNISSINFLCERSMTLGNHMINIELSNTTGRVKNSLIENCSFMPTNGKSIKLNNPNLTDGFFTSNIQNNLIYGGIEFIRCGDSVNLLRNTITGYNGIDISLVDGSNSFIIENNNITCRKGIVIRSGHNIKVLYNNIECGYPDSQYLDNSIVNFKGDNITHPWGLLGCEFVGNNISYRATAPNGINGVYVDKCRGLTIKDNHITRKESTMIVITSKATDTFIDKNVWSSPTGSVILDDKGINTRIINQVITDERGHRKYISDVSKIHVNNTDETVNDNIRILYKAKTKNDTIKEIYEWDNANTFKSKVGKYTSNNGNNKLISSLYDGFEVYESEGIAIKDSSGFVWKLIVGTDGSITTRRVN